ncbi:MAG TPA: hypothetical protein VIX15_13460, partial [Streptosporangiaceae bacterium]
MARLMITAHAGAPAGVADAWAGTDGGGAGRSSARRWGLLLVAGWLVQAGLRAWLSRAQVVPLANPDETAYLITARLLAGGPPADFSGSTLYQVGYPLLIMPVYWFTHDPVTVYRAVLMINAAIGALLMPLSYVAGRRIGLGRPAAYGAATLTGTVPAGVFYSEYAMTDAIFPVIVVAWLLCVHSWLTAPSRRGRYAAAAGSAAAAGYAYAVHLRGLVIVIAYVACGVFIAWRRLAPRWTAVAAGATLLAIVGASCAVNRYLAGALYPEGARSLTAQMATKMANVHGAINVAEMAAGQMWRLVLDSWGVAGIGLVAAAALVVRRGVRTDLRIMAALGVVVTAVTAATAPAALPQDQSQTWASGRYLDGMIVTFFLIGAVVLLRARPRFILICAGATAVVTLLCAGLVYIYAGSSLPTNIFAESFNFGEPAVLTQNWNGAGVWLTTVVALGLLAVWVLIALAARRWTGAVLPAVRVSRVLRTAGVAGLAAVSLVAVTQMTSHISQASTPSQAASTTGFVAATGLKPGDRIAVAFEIGTGIPATDVPYYLWAPQAFEVTWTELEFFNPAQPPPADVTVVET